VRFLRRDRGDFALFGRETAELAVGRKRITRSREHLQVNQQGMAGQ
jgi:hypothetical protein